MSARTVAKDVGDGIESSVKHVSTKLCCIVELRCALLALNDDIARLSEHPQVQRLDVHVAEEDLTRRHRMTVFTLKRRVGGVVMRLSSMFVCKHPPPRGVIARFAFNRKALQVGMAHARSARL